MLCRDSMLFHELMDPQVFIFKSSGCGVLPPGTGLALWRSSLLSRVPLMLGQVASLLVADEALLVSHVLHSFTGREIDLVHIHGIRVSGWSAGLHVLGQQDKGVFSTSKSLESYHVSVELSCLIKPLLPFPSGLLLTVTCSIAKVFLGSAKTRRAILTERPTSFWG